MNNTILLVDDNPSNLAVLYDHLSQADYKIVVMDNGIDAVEKAIQIQPTLILLDIRMPGMDGYETCRAIKSNQTTADVPIIFLSALNEVNERLKGFQAGGVDFVTKPINVLEVTARVETHITLARLRQALAEANLRLEERVEARTIELQEEIALHQQEIDRRKQAEQEKQQLLHLLREQNKQLHSFTDWMLQSRPAVHLELTHLISQQLLDNIASISAELKLSQTAKEPQDAARHVTNARLRSEQLHQFLRTISLDKAAKQPTLPTTIPAAVASLTNREREVLRLIADGVSSEDIGQQLAIAETTVRSYRLRIMRKINTHTVAGLVKFALIHNLTDLQV